MLKENRYKHLLFRNQFIIGPEFDDRLDDWQKVDLDSACKLQVHPDLNYYQVKSDNRWIVLLGFILDPENIEDSNTDIVNKLMDSLVRYTDVIEKTNGMGGRWILMINDGERKVLLNDAMGTRQLFYTRSSALAQGLWCASQPALIGHKLDLILDEEAIAFVDSHEFRKMTDYRWPGECTQYKEVRHLLPNHYLDLDTGKPVRFWPDRELIEMPLATAVEKISTKMQGLIQAVSRRQELAIAITAGIDSRLVIASSRSIKDRPTYVTIRQIDKPEDHPDVTISSQLSKSHGLKHDILKSSLIVDNDFLDFFMRHNFLAHPVNLYDAYAYFKYYGLKKIAVTGSGSEIARDNYRRKLNLSKRHPVTASNLIKLTDMQNSKFVRKAFENWLSDIDTPYNIDIMNIYQWELSHGNWVANNYLEYDLAWNDIFTPYNCRALLIDMLSIKEADRIGPRYQMHRALIQALWPELMELPVNPHRKPKKKLSRSIITKHIPPAIKETLKKS